VAVRDEDHVAAGPAEATRGGRLHGAPAVRLHLTLAAGLALCVAAFTFEVGRALGGNSLSWAYVFEWPIFAVFAVYMWWNLLHDTDGDRSRRRSAAPSDGSGAAVDEAADTGAAASGDPPDDAGDTAGDAAVDPDLAAWQAYLRTMEADERRQAREDGVG
jgi:hypothetical protein